MTPIRALDTTRQRAVRVLDALGAAWSTYRLYPDPRRQPPFLRAVATLEAAVGELPVIGVGPGTFFIDGEEVLPERDGTERLARRLFLHDVETIELVAETSPDGLDAFFAVLAADDDDEVTAASGIAARLVGAAGVGIRVRQRGLLNLDPDAAGIAAVPVETAALEPEGLPEAARIALRGAAPVEIAALVARERGTASVVAFLEAFHELHDRIETSLSRPGPPLLAGIRLPVDDPYRTVRSFIESFFHLPRWLQVEILHRVLEDLSLPSHQVFLDQFSGNDLVDLAGDLPPSAQEALLGYAVEASADRSGGHPLDLLAGLRSAAEVEEARRAVAERVAAVLDAARRGSRDDELDALRLEMEVPVDDAAAELTILRALLGCERRDDRFRRVVRVWTGRISRHLRRDDPAAAARLLGGILRDPPYPLSRVEAVTGALERMVTEDFLQRLAGLEEAEPESVAEILALLGRVGVERLVGRLAEEEDRSKRRWLVDLLAIAARGRTADVAIHLGDPRWYLVRNLVLALGRTGNADAVGAVRTVLGHADHRVRTECLRALVRLSRSAATGYVVRGLSDEHEQVRRAAVRLLRGSELDDVDRLASEALASGRMPLDTAVEVVHVLGVLEGPVGAALLRRLARRRLVLGRRARALRRAARTTLAEWEG